MDYSRMAEHKYRLNEDCGTYSPEARKQKENYERTLLGKEEKAAGRKTGQRAGGIGNSRAGGTSGGIGNGQAGRTSGGSGAGRAEKAQAGYTDAARQSRPKKQADGYGRMRTKTGGTGRRPASVIKWVVIVWIALGILSGIVTGLPGWFSRFGETVEQAADWPDDDTGIEMDIGDDPEEDTDFGDSENEAATTEGLYEYVKSEMPADGEAWSEFLAAGYYTVGETLPQGTYRVTVSEGQGSLHVEDEDNAIWYYSWMEPGNEVEDLRLYPGARVTVEGGCELEFESENARPEELTPYAAGDFLEDVGVFTGETYLVGDDIAPGRYDVQYVPDGDSGIAELRVETADGDTQTIFLSDYGPDEGYRDMFHNLDLAEGDTVALEGAMENDMVYLLPELEFP